MCPLNVPSCRAGQGWGISVGIRGHPHFYVNIDLFSDLSYSKTCSVGAAGRPATASLGWWSMGLGLAMLPPSHTADTWGSVESVGMNKTARTGKRGNYYLFFFKKKSIILLLLLLLFKIILVLVLLAGLTMPQPRVGRAPTPACLLPALQALPTCLVGVCS